MSSPDIEGSGVSLLLTTEKYRLPVLNVSYFHFVSQQTIRELFDMNDAEKKEMAVELSVPHAEEEETGNKQSTTILEQVWQRQKPHLFSFSSLLNTLSHAVILLV